MANEALKAAYSALFPLITERLRRAHDIAAAASVCSASGNYEGAFRILLDIEEPACDANVLLNAASVIRRESEE